MDTLVLGLDGGGTKTQLVVAASDGRIVLATAGAGINPMDNSKWRENLEELLLAVSPLHSSIRFAVLGLPGHGEIRAVTDAMDKAVSEYLPIPHRNENDVRVALDGAFLNGPGTLVLAGTGSMVLAKGSEGRITRAGGWGEIFSDEGGAYWIGQLALRRASQALDGRLDAPAFAAALLSEIGAQDRDWHDAMMGWCLSRKHQRSEIATLARFVDRLADKGDETAIAIMTAAAAELTIQLKTAQRLAGHIGQAWSPAGSVFDSSTVMHHMTRMNGPCQPAILTPVGGAVWSALQTAGIQPEDAFAETFTAELVRAFTSP
ncbi:MAG: ATPase [Hyphomicrobiales bacterium]|nr:MAG: ATPase [Hyphomicrobiales bacterium]